MTVNRFKFESKLIYIVPGYMQSNPWNVDLMDRAGFEYRTSKRGGGLLILEDVLNAEIPRFHSLTHDFWRDCQLASRLSTCGLANPMAEELGRRLISLEPPHVPKIAYQFGYEGERATLPNCHLTPESVTCGEAMPMLVILPKRKKVAFQSLNVLDEITRDFGIRIEGEPKDKERYFDQLEWLRNLRPNRIMLNVIVESKLSSEELIASLVFAAELLDSKHERIASAHVLAEFDGAPRVRQYWTSPPT